jgi:hypothetical protein
MKGGISSGISPSASTRFPSRACPELPINKSEQPGITGSNRKGEESTDEIRGEHRKWKKNGC